MSTAGAMLVGYIGGLLTAAAAYFGWLADELGGDEETTEDCVPPVARDRTYEGRDDDVRGVEP